MAQSNNARGAALITFSSFSFTCNDIAMKAAFLSIPVAEGIFARGIFGTLFIALLAWRLGALTFRPTRREARFLAIRTFAELGSTVTYLHALSVMPIATASSVLQFVPLGVTMAAALLLGEHVGWRRWTAIAVGLCGVLIMIQPGTQEFDANLLYPLATAGFVILRDITTRSMSPRVPTVFASLLTMVTVTIFAGLWMSYQGIVVPDQTATVTCLIAGVFIIAGYIMSVSGIRIGDISAVSPFRYTILIWSMSLGYLVFGEVPTASTIAGALLVVAAGLYTLWRETRVSRATVAAEADSRPFRAE